MESEVVTDQSIEEKLTAAYQREEDAGKEPPEEVKEPVEKKAEKEPEEVEEKTEPQDDDSEEIEFEGELYKLPKKLKEGVLRQKDYTQKAQEAAEMKRIAEAERASLQVEAEFQRKHFDKAVQMHGLQNQLQQFSQVDWDKLAEENPTEYLRLDRKHRELEREAGKVHQEMQGLGGQFEAQRRENLQKAQAQCVQELKRDLPVTPELLKELDAAGRSNGFTAQELASIVDPRHIRVLHKAMQWDKLQASKSSVEKKVQTAKPVQVTASRTSQSTQANQKLDDMRSKAKKTGKDSDVEAFLAARFAKTMK